MEETNQSFHLLREFHQLGCCDEALCAAACRLYIHLCEERFLWDVQYHYSKELDIIFLKARKKKDAPEDVYVPVLSFDAIPMATIERYQSELTDASGANGNRSVILAFCDPSSSILMYKMTNMIKPLEDKPLSKNKRAKEKKLKMANKGKKV